MGTDTRSALDQPTMTAPTSKPPRDKVMRIATMTKLLLDEFHAQVPDTASLERVRAIDTHVIDELHADLPAALRDELQRLALPLTRHTELSDSELRLAHAQLVGWLQGLLQTAHTALGEAHTVVTNDSRTVQIAPIQDDRPHVEPRSSIEPVPDDSAPNDDNPAIRSARQTLITAITRRITQQGLTAAQAATVLHLTGPRVTQLFQANIDEFTLNELVNLLPALELSLQIVPAPNQE